MVSLRAVNITNGVFHLFIFMIVIFVVVKNRKILDRTSKYPLLFIVLISFIMMIVSFSVDTQQKKVSKALKKR